MPPEPFELKVGDRIQVDVGLPGLRLLFATVLINVGPNELWLGLDSPDRRLERMRLGNPVAMSVARHGGAGVGRSEFLRAMGGSRSRAFAVRRPEKFDEVQRRSTARCAVEMPVRFRRLDPTTWQPRSRSSAGSTVNVSPGGLLIRTQAQVMVGDVLELMVPLAGGDRISTTDQVVRVERPMVAAMAGEVASGTDGIDGPASSDVAVKFTRITPIDRDWITRLMLVTEHRRQQSAVRAV
jgi:hypothetical protein